MRLQSFTEHFSLLTGLGLLLFCCSDEEPLLDFTDLNLLHVLVLGLAGCVVIFEPVLRARSGQLGYKDVTTLLAAFTFWLQLENYSRVILLICSLHALLPLEVDLFELSSLWGLTSAWLTAEFLPASLGVGLLAGLAFVLRFAFGTKRRTFGLMLLLIVCAGHAWLCGYLGWDLLVGGLTSLAEPERGDIFYLSPRTGLTYDRGLRVADQFEWHRERVTAYSLRFEELYIFFFRLLLFWDLCCSLLCWGFLVGTHLRETRLGVSYTQLSLGLLWLRQLVCAITFDFLVVGGVGVRLLAVLPLELGQGWVL